jgi:GNAT superfamily N-acetyltransferase
MESRANIRVVQPEDAGTVGKVIIEMLADAPLAFGESLAEARARTPAEWKEIVEYMVRPGSATALLAFDESGPCGFVCADSGYPEAPPETVVISRVWVAPRQRGSGLGRRLMEAASDWAAGQHAKLLALGVTEINVTAMQFYEHLGYREVGMRIPWPPDPTKQIIILGRELNR